ncbi:MAG: alpha-galactosidase [Planctomycetaceae bacterium]|nr:alpha-galactosidase [Planctomycetaceae bacterium]
MSSRQILTISILLFTGLVQAAQWSVELNKDELSLKNGQIAITGKLSFNSDGNVWTISPSRDGVANRFALVDTKNNVQGYIVFVPNGESIKLHFYHRTAQSYPGMLSFSGKIAFLKDGFPCRTKPQTNERVLPLQTENADSRLNDSLFSPENDTVLQLTAAQLQIRTLSKGHFAVDMSGQIHLPSEAEFTFSIESDYFKKRYVPYYHAIDRKRCPKVPTGWMSWNTYFDKATAEDNLNEAKIGKKYLQPFGCEIWSIESWQGNSEQLPVSKFYNMNLEVNEEQFPDGMKKLADDIRALGFRPGLWMAPFGTGNEEFYHSHKNWFLHRKDGLPIGSWNGKYTLDPSVAEAREHLKQIFNKASHDWGYEFFKIDGMSGRSDGYGAHLYERPEIKECFSDTSCPNPFELCVQNFRAGIGDDRIFLACQGHTSGPEAKYADAARLGADIVHPNEPVKWANVMNQGRCTLNQIFTHNIVLYADPDTLLVRDLPLEEARTSATIVALPGQVTFFGDKLAGLTDEQMKMLQQTLPAADVRPGSLYPYFAMLPVWNLSVHHDKLGDYNVVALFNWLDASPHDIGVSVQELGLPDGQYLGYEFWTQKPVKIENNTLLMQVPVHGVRVIVIHRDSSIPQWIGSDRHLAQTGQEILDYKWDENNKTLKGKIRLVGNFPLTMRLHIPEKYHLERCSIPVTIKNEPDNTVAVTFQSKESIDAEFQISFKTE